MTSRRTHLFFDIDGTLLLTRGQGRQAVASALADVFGRELDLSGVAFSGKTDFQILEEIAASNGIDLAEAGSAKIIEAADLYVRTLHSILETAHINVLKGCAELLARLHADDRFQLAILTGNLESTAKLKLRLADLEQYFPFGAYGSDHSDRYELPAIGLSRASDYASESISPRNAVIIGDTEHDILCGRSLGIRSVAVCTGRFGRHELEPHGPDVLFDDLSDTSSVYNKLEEMHFSD